MEPSIFTYLLVMSAVTLAIRILPLTLIRGEVKSPFLKSFLYYVPYVTLARHDPGHPKPRQRHTGPARGADSRLVGRQPLQGSGSLLRRGFSDGNGDLLKKSTSHVYIPKAPLSIDISKWTC